MPKPPFRWTKYRLAVRSLLTDHGYTVAMVQKEIGDDTKKAAKEQGWRMSELAATLADRYVEIDDIARRLGLEERCQ